MSDFLWLLIVFAGYVVLIRWILPAFGIGT